jgi:acyl-CoA reductase-like NAD-dependent aldehyde dehydrogenase
MSITQSIQTILKSKKYYEQGFSESGSKSEQLEIIEEFIKCQELFNEELRVAFRTAQAKLSETTIEESSRLLSQIWELIDEQSNSLSKLSSANIDSSDDYIQILNYKKNKLIECTEEIDSFLRRGNFRLVEELLSETLSVYETKDYTEIEEIKKKLLSGLS